MDDPRNVLACEAPEREAVRNVEVGKAKTILEQTFQDGEPGQFQADQTCFQVVNANHGVAAFDQPLNHMKADESGRARDECLRYQGSAAIRFSASNSNAPRYDTRACQRIRRLTD